MNYQKELDKTLEKLTKEERVPKLLLHSCCAIMQQLCAGISEPVF